MFLMPNMIVKASKSLNHSLAQERFLFDCYECGCCAYVCPSKINHIKWFRMSKKIQSVKKK
jgi:Na+-translocating ferredoxin:NAD+ oxidoreductase subunit C